jgi:hypothetical protein
MADFAPDLKFGSANLASILAIFTDRLALPLRVSQC